ncbi:aminotransferase-like domain-containing protein [Aestuariimicrobium ganziense]|uniref:aminotransferase-like domain-containing protein n=1 Tax=Aestuariimicrobium ganziense TaxID=2773677 RepID=UPI002E2BB339|nr:PLP-dependent aminotransferase family protein [Aestuariimicrobium ganziense]
MSLPQPPAPRPERHDTRLDRYVEQYADRTHTMQASAVRALFAVANRPEVVSLAGGMPNITDLPLNVVADSLQNLIMTEGTKAMQYGSGQGEPMIREQICEVMGLEGIVAHPDDVVVTCGSQQALDLVTRIFCNPGDVVIAEAPSYVGALTTFRSYQVEVVHVTMDDDGIRTDALAQAVTACRAAGKNPKFLYTIPNFSNPSGISQTADRRREVLQTCLDLDLLVVEDNPYGLLSLDAEPLPALRSMEDEQVLYLGSFSKTFAPGFRIGWALAPHAVREKLTLAQEAATLCPPVFSQYAVSSYLRDHDWQNQIVSFKDMYRARRDAMLEALEEYMPEGTTWTNPAGGFFVWVTMPEGLDSQSMLPRAVTDRVAYTPGTAFYADGLGSRNLRLSFCYPPPDRIREGVRRLAEVMRRELDLHHTFGLGTSPRHDGLTSGPGPEVS